MIVIFIRCMRHHRKSGMTLRNAIARAWANSRERDSFHPLSKRIL